MTLFSAPNYCGEFDNAGAMMSVDETLMCSFQVSKRSSRPLVKNHKTTKRFLLLNFAQFPHLCLPFFFLNRFSNLQTRSCSMAAAVAWALVAQSPPQGKLRNDTSSLPSTSEPIPPALSTSLLLSFTKQPEIKPYTQGFFPFLSVLLKTFNVTNCLSECVRARMTNSSAGEH